MWGLSEDRSGRGRRFPTGWAAVLVILGVVSYWVYASAKRVPVPMEPAVEAPAVAVGPGSELEGLIGDEAGTGGVRREEAFVEAPSAEPVSFRRVSGEVVFPEELPDGEPCTVVAYVTTQEPYFADSFTRLGDVKIASDRAFSFDVPSGTTVCLFALEADFLFCDEAYWNLEREDEGSRVVLAPELGSNLTLKFRLDGATAEERERMVGECFALQLVRDNDILWPQPRLATVTDDLRLTFLGVRPGYASLRDVFHESQLGPEEPADPGPSENFLDDFGARTQTRMRLTQGQHAVEEVQLVRLHLTRGRVVHSNGQPLSRVAVRFQCFDQRHLRGAPREYSTVTDRDGQFWVKLPSGSAAVVVSAQAKGYLPFEWIGDGTLGGLPVKDGERVITLKRQEAAGIETAPEVKPGDFVRMPIQLIDTRSEPAPSASMDSAVELRVLTPQKLPFYRNGGHRPIKLRNSQSGEIFDGELSGEHLHQTFAGVQPGAYWVTVEYRGLGALTRRIEVPNQPLYVVDLREPPADRQPVFGRLTSGGRPVQGHRLQLWVGASMLDYVITDQDGRFELEAPGVSRARLRDGTSGRDWELELTPAPGATTLELKLVDNVVWCSLAAIESIRGTRLAFVRNEDLQLYRAGELAVAELIRREVGARSVIGTRLRFLHVPPDRYVAVLMSTAINHRDIVHESHAFDIPMGVEHHVELTWR